MRRAVREVTQRRLVGVVEEVLRKMCAFCKLSSKSIFWKVRRRVCAVRAQCFDGKCWRIHQRAGIDFRSSKPCTPGCQSAMMREHCSVRIETGMSENLAHQAFSEHFKSIQHFDGSVLKLGALRRPRHAEPSAW
jgi:hypothetical protein